MTFDEYWNSESLDCLRKKFPDLNGDEVRCIWDHAKAENNKDECAYEPPLSEKRIIAAGAGVLEGNGFERMTAVLVADDCWRAMLREAVRDGHLTLPNTD